MADLKQRLSKPGVTILDGATGTQLQTMGLPLGKAPDLWNLDNPTAVKQHHQAYLDAGAGAILTNTFGANGARLALEGAANRAREINLAAARLAREVAGDSVLVLGSVGPTGKMMAPLGDLTEAQAEAYFAEQAAALAEGGVDAIYIETMSDLKEAEAAIRAAQQMTNLPVTITMSFDTEGHTLRGVSPQKAVQRLWELGAAAVGANCGCSLEENLQAIKEMRHRLPEARLIAKPNAGLPEVGADGRPVYTMTPARLAEYALKFVAQQVSLFGGCCGTTPEHIHAVKRALEVKI